MNIYLAGDSNIKCRSIAYYVALGHGGLVGPGLFNNSVCATCSYKCLLLLRVTILHVLSLSSPLPINFFMLAVLNSSKLLTSYHALSTPISYNH